MRGFWECEGGAERVPKRRSRRRGGQGKNPMSHLKIFEGHVWNPESWEASLDSGDSGPKGRPGVWDRKPPDHPSSRSPAGSPEHVKSTVSLVKIHLINPGSCCTSRLLPLRRRGHRRGGGRAYGDGKETELIRHHRWLTFLHLWKTQGPDPRRRRLGNKRAEGGNVAGGRVK